jgi:hypothetical protein
MTVAIRRQRERALSAGIPEALCKNGLFYLPTIVNMGP